MQGRTGVIACGMLTLFGCADALPPAMNEAPETATVMAQAFDPARTGTVQGRVLWDGAAPEAQSTVVKAIAYHFTLHEKPVRHETAHVPRVHPENGGVAAGVVFLRGVDLRRCKPWSHGETLIEFRDRQMRITQGKQLTNVGFVRRGGKVTTINRDPDYHALRGRGADFFTLPLTTADRVSEQQLKQNGRVELFDAAGYYWLHAHLFVDEHPYYARTDEDGNYVLDQVPEGDYEIVSWMPSWIVTQRERDPETGLVARLVWASPQEQLQKIHVQGGRTAEIRFRWSRQMFDGGESKNAGVAR